MYPIEHNGPEFAYILKYKKDYDTSLTTIEISDDAETCKEIQTNDIYKKYTVYVLARNVEGLSGKPQIKYTGYSGMAGKTKFSPLVVF